MTLRAAQHHERHSAEHAYNITDTAAQVWWDAPADPADWSLPSKYEPPLSREEMRVRESQSQVDHVHDMVPFWIKGVEAAEKGEVISSMEDFLNMLQEDPWLTGNDWGHVWGEQANAQDGWGAGNEIAWGANPKETTEHARKKEATWDSNEQHRAKGRYSEGKMPRGISRNAHEFVEDVARQQAADEEQKRRMHSFFEARAPRSSRLRKLIFGYVF